MGPLHRKRGTYRKRNSNRYGIPTIIEKREDGEEMMMTMITIMGAIISDN